MVRMRSVSVENLDSIVKQIFSVTLQDAGRVMNFQQEIYEEWYTKKKIASVVEQVEENGQDSTVKTTFEDNSAVEKEGSTAHDSKYKVDVAEIEKKSSSEKIVNVNNSVENNASNEIVYHESKNKPGNVNYSTDENTSKMFGETCMGQEGENDLKKNTVSSYNGTVPEMSTVVPRKVKVRKNIKLSESDNQEMKRKTGGERVKSELTFEMWKRKKTFHYKQMFRRERLKRRLQLEEEEMEKERKRIAYETYLRTKVEERNYKTALLKKREQMNKQAYKEISKQQAEAKRLINEQAFKCWKRKKDMELKERRRMMMIYANNCYQQPPKPAPLKSKQRTAAVNTQFGSWLDQLDWVLHEKYLRERRYRVRSFYCQPAYYGTAAIYAR